MAMREETKKALEILEKKYKGTARSWKVWECVVNLDEDSNITFGTFKRYVKLKKEVVKTEKTLEELVNLLNDSAGEDLYNCSWKFEVINGKAYEVETFYRWE